MIVQEKDSSESVAVHAIYWIDGKRYYLVIPYQGFEGLDVLSKDDCIVLDQRIGNEFVLYENNGVDILVNKALLENDLLSRAIDFEPGAIDEYLALLK